MVKSSTCIHQQDPHAVGARIAFRYQKTQTTLWLNAIHVPRELRNVMDIPYFLKRAHGDGMRMRPQYLIVHIHWGVSGEIALEICYALKAMKVLHPIISLLVGRVINLI